MEAAQKILAYNICSKTLEKEGMDYFVRNESVAKDVVIFLDAVKERIIQGVTRINLMKFSTVKYHVHQMKKSKKKKY